ncbi:hypothetical protein B0H13DRAFT_2284982 [Mycena leptocephala]|nr:hypothetical protein B0H13DRAFT_2284982 [Mycena leptocephala]
MRRDELGTNPPACSVLVLVRDGERESSLLLLLIDPPPTSTRTSVSPPYTRRGSILSTGTFHEHEHKQEEHKPLRHRTSICIKRTAKPTSTVTRTRTAPGRPSRRAGLASFCQRAVGRAGEREADAEKRGEESQQREGAVGGRKDGRQNAGTGASTASTDTGGARAGKAGVRVGEARGGRGPGRRAEGGGRSPTPDARSTRWYHALVTRASGCGELGASRTSVTPKMGRTRRKDRKAQRKGSGDVHRVYEEPDEGDGGEALSTRGRGRGGRGRSSESRRGRRRGDRARAEGGLGHTRHGPPLSSTTHRPFHKSSANPD